MNERRASGAGAALAYTVLGLFTLLSVGPLVWLLYSSLKPTAEIVLSAAALPKLWTLANYAKAWKLGALSTAILNSVVYTGVATAITAGLALAAGFGFAKFEYRAAKTLYALFIAGLLITVHAVVVPLFVMESRVGIINTRLGVILPYIAFGLPMAILLATAYIKGVPDSLIESATIDGAGYLRIFRTIIAPVSTPVLGTIVILTFLNNWNEFTFAYILTSGRALKSLPVSVNAFAGVLNSDYGTQFAALLVATVPMLVFYAFFRRQLMQGFADGALKE
jgi:raffinose/stachyose/melibiose transport system permease protein